MALKTEKTVQTVSSATESTSVVYTASDDSITLGSDTWDIDAIIKGDTLTISGSANNDGTYTVNTALDFDQLTVDEALTDETDNAPVGATITITRTVSYFNDANNLITDINDVSFNEKFYVVNGRNYGYQGGGVYNVTPTTYNVIDRYPFAASTTNATDVGDLIGSRSYTAGVSSATKGYNQGGLTSPTPTAWTVTKSSWPFADSTTNSTAVGDLTLDIAYCGGCHNETHGYTAGGYGPPPTSYNDEILRFSFASDGETSSDVGNLTTGKLQRCEGCMSYTHGYASSGALPPSTDTDEIERWPFAAGTTNATTNQLLSTTRNSTCDLSSVDYGYAHYQGGTTDSIDRWPFANDTETAVTVGDTIVGFTNPARTMSVEYGYLAGSTPGSDTIERFPFASTVSDTVDVGNLSVSRGAGAGVFF